MRQKGKEETMTSSRLPLHAVSRAACAFTLAGAVACGDGSPPAPAHDARVEAGLQRVLDQAVARPDVLLPGAITYYRAPAWAPWSGSAGLGELEAQVPMRPESRIRAGSVLKTFLATVTLQHVEEGMLSLDQTLPELLPSAVTDRVANADRITLRMLLNHTSGIPEWVGGEVHATVVSHPEHVWTTDEALAIAAGTSAYFEPGTSWQYSNTNYTLLGMVLDRVGGTSWRAQIRARVLAPLGLTSTELPEPGDRTIAADYAHGYQDVGGAPVDLSFVDPSMAGASGGNAMVTTVRDLARFIDALFAGELFARRETLVEMTTMVDAPNGTGLPHRYGLGLESYELGGTPVIGNSGGAAGYTVMMFRVPDRAATLVTAVNTSDLFTNALDVFAPSLDVVTGRAE
jgi:D-alanyl-D-alanine carboxypeptidase